MRVPTEVLKAVTHLVAVVGSLLLVLVFTAVLPPGLGSVVLLGMIVVVGLVAGGVLEGLAVRLTTRASAPTDAELHVLANIPDLAGSQILVCRTTSKTTSATAPVVITGRFTVVSAPLVEALFSGWANTLEVTALVVHARAHHQVIAPRRGEVAIALIETPWRIVVGIFRGVGSAFGWMPLGSLAWRLRGVVGVVCVVQPLAGSRIWPGGLGATVIALSYLVPAAGRAIEVRATAAGDVAVVAAGLGGVLVEVLGRSGQQLSLERRQRLQGSPSSGPSTDAQVLLEGPTRHLHLVRR